MLFSPEFLIKNKSKKYMIKHDSSSTESLLKFKLFLKIICPCEVN